MLVSNDTFVNTLFYLRRLILKIKLFHLYLLAISNLMNLSNQSLNRSRVLDSQFLSCPLRMDLQASKDRQHPSKINSRSAIPLTKIKRRSTSTTMTKKRQNNCDIFTFYAINYFSCYY